MTSDTGPYSRRDALDQTRIRIAEDKIKLGILNGDIRRANNPPPPSRVVTLKRETND